MNFQKITNKKLYHEYTKRHLALANTLSDGAGTKNDHNEYYVLGLIIDDYHRSQTNPFADLTPVDFLKHVMEENGYSGYKIYKEIGISQSVISDILNYKRGFSKDVIRKLSEKFNVPQEAFLKDYELTGKKERV